MIIKYQYLNHYINTTNTYRNVAPPINDKVTRSVSTCSVFWMTYNIEQPITWGIIDILYISLNSTVGKVVSKHHKWPSGGKTILIKNEKGEIRTKWMWAALPPSQLLQLRHFYFTGKNHRILFRRPNYPELLKPCELLWFFRDGYTIKRKKGSFLQKLRFIAIMPSLLAQEPAKAFRKPEKLKAKHFMTMFLDSLLDGAL